MGGFLMVLIMMGFVRDRLGRGKAPDHKNTHDKEANEEPSDHTLHRSSHCNRTGEWDGTGVPPKESRRRLSRNPVSSW